MTSFSKSAAINAIARNNQSTSPLCCMTDRVDPSAVLDMATEAVIGVTDTVQQTTDGIADAIQKSRQPGDGLNQLARVIRDAPLTSLAIAFMVGVLFSRRR